MRVCLCDIAFEHDDDDDERALCSPCIEILLLLEICLSCRCIAAATATPTTNMKQMRKMVERNKIAREKEKTFSRKFII